MTVLAGERLRRPSARVTERNGQGLVEKAVRAEFRSLRVTLGADGSAALAISLAQQIDNAKGAASAALASAQLRQLLIDLRASAEARSTERDAIDDLRGDELAARRAR